MKNRKKMAGTIAMIMALSLGYNAGGPVVVHAHENAVITEKLGETAASQEGVIDFSAIKDNEDLEVADYLPSDINDMEKICTEDYSVNLVDMADNTEDNKTVNDNPNDAKAISLGTQVYDTVATELEQRWYAFSVAKATKFTAAMDDDLNTADAIAAIFDIVYASNTALSNENKNAKAVVEKTLDLIHELGGVLGLFQKTQEKSIDAEVEELIEKRNKARSEKNWAEADAIRDKLKAMNIELKDTPMGVKWNYISE